MTHDLDSLENRVAEIENGQKSDEDDWLGPYDSHDEYLKDQWRAGLDPDGPDRADFESEIEWLAAWRRQQRGDNE